MRTTTTWCRADRLSLVALDPSRLFPRRWHCIHRRVATASRRIAPPVVSFPTISTVPCLVETLVALGQTVPPVAVLAIAVPLIGFGALPALIALALYGLLPVLSAAIAGLESVPQSALDAADGVGMSGAQRLLRVELPLALPVLLTGVRSSVVINIGTATIASTVGASTLGSPIIVGLSGFNTAYVIQGALLVGLLAVVVDLGFDRAGRRWSRWRQSD